jgi:HSP20 family protein
MADRQSTKVRTEQSNEQRGLEGSSPNRGLARQRREPFDVFDFSPLAMIRRMQDDMDRLFGSFGAGSSWMRPFRDAEAAEWAPAIEAFQRGNEFVVRADVPGLSRDDLSVDIGDDAVTIRGERKYDHQEEREGVFRSERSYGSFCRVVQLPEGTVTDSAKANFKNGVLEITVQAPPQEVRRGRRLEISEEKNHGTEQKQ